MIKQLLVIFFVLFLFIEVSGQSDKIKIITNECVIRNISSVKTNDSSFVIFSTTNDSIDNFVVDHRPNINHIDFFILKTNSSGRLLWKKRFQDNYSWDHSSNIFKSTNKSIYLTGIKQQSDGKWLLKTIKYDSCFNYLILDTAYLLGTYSKSNVRYSICEDSDENLICFYLINDSINNLNYDNLYMRKFKQNGSQLFAKKIDIELTYQGDMRFIENLSNDRNFYFLIRKKTPQPKFDSINELRIGFNDIEKYEILKINSDGKICEVIDLPIQNDLDVKFYNFKKQFIGFANNYFNGDKFMNSFNPSTYGYWQRMDSSYLSLKFFSNNFHNEILIKKFKLDFTLDARIIQPASNIILGFDSCYVFLYKYELSDSSYYHFVKTDLKGNIIWDKTLEIDPYNLEGEAFLQAETTGYTIIGGLRKIDERYKQHIRTLFMMKLDINGNSKSF